MVCVICLMLPQVPLQLSRPPTATSVILHGHNRASESIKLGASQHTASYSTEKMPSSNPILQPSYSEALFANQAQSTAPLITALGVLRNVHSRHEYNYAAFVNPLTTHSRNRSEQANKRTALMESLKSPSAATLPPRLDRQPTTTGSPVRGRGLLGRMHSTTSIGRGGINGIAITSRPTALPSIGASIAARHAAPASFELYMNRLNDLELDYDLPDDQDFAKMYRLIHRYRVQQQQLAEEAVENAAMGPATTTVQSRISHSEDASPSLPLFKTSLATATASAAAQLQQSQVC